MLEFKYIFLALISITFTLYYIDFVDVAANIKLFVDNDMKIERMKPTSNYAHHLCGYVEGVEVITTWDYFYTHSASSIEITIQDNLPNIVPEFAPYFYINL